MFVVRQAVIATSGPLATGRGKLHRLGRLRHGQHAHSTEQASLSRPRFRQYKGPPKITISRMRPIDHSSYANQDTVVVKHAHYGECDLDVLYTFRASQALQGVCFILYELLKYPCEGHACKKAVVDT